MSGSFIGLAQVVPPLRRVRATRAREEGDEGTCLVADVTR
jgi:hypothetical protein